MTRSNCTSVVVIGVVLTGLCATASAQATRDQYDRALNLRQRYQALVTGVPESVTWIARTNRFVYRRSVSGGHEFVLVDAASGEKRAPFDHARLASALSRRPAVRGRHRRCRSTRSVSSIRNERSSFSSTRRAGRACWPTIAARKTTGRPRIRPGVLRGVNGPVRGPHVAPSDAPRPSPDGKWEALINNYNLAVRRPGASRHGAE